MRARWSIAVCLWLSTCLAHAQQYELRRIESLLADEQLAVDPVPEGKIIDFVRIVRDDVFVDDEIWPTWFNLFHGLTKDAVVRREVLLSPGDIYQEARVEETMRNLRSMGIFALVHVEAVKATSPDHVGLLVHTRDMWSLRLEEDFNITNRVNYLLVRLTERNIAGRNQAVGLDLEVVPKQQTYRAFHTARRIALSGVSASESAAIYVGSDAGKAEGYGVGSVVGMPLYTLAQRFGFEASGAYTTRIVRSVRDGEVHTFTPNEGGPSALRVYRRRAATGGLDGLMRQGHILKRSSRLGLDVRDASADPVAETMLPPELEAAFRRDVLPRERREIGPAFSYGLWQARYATLHDLGAFGVSENVRVGPSWSIGARLPLRALGSSEESLVVASDAGYVYAKHNGLIEVSLGGSSRREGGAWIDQVIGGQVRGATPPLAGLRLVARLGLQSRRRDSQNAVVSLGGNNGLRGYPSQALFGNGASHVLGNLELRTGALEWQAVHVGALLFFDVGSVHERWSELDFLYATGVGLRFFFPQFNRYPVSADVGAPIDPGFRLVPTLTTGQVVRLTATEDALAN